MIDRTITKRHKTIRKRNNSKLLKSNIRTLASIIIGILITSQYCAKALISYDNSLLYYDIDGHFERMLMVANCHISWNRTKLVRTLMRGNVTGTSGAQISSKDNLLLYQSDDESFIGPTISSNSLKLPADKRTDLPSDCVFVVDWMDYNIYYFHNTKLYLMDLYGFYEEQFLYDCQCDSTTIRALTIELTFHFLVWIQDNKFVMKTDKIGNFMMKYKIKKGNILSLTADPFNQRFIMIVSAEDSLFVQSLSYDLIPLDFNDERQYSNIELPKIGSLKSNNWDISSTALCLNNLMFVLKIDDHSGIVGKLGLDGNVTEYSFTGRIHIFSSMIYNLLDPCKKCQNFGSHYNQTDCFCFCDEEPCYRLNDSVFWLYSVWISIALMFILLGYALSFHRNRVQKPNNYWGEILKNENNNSTSGSSTMDSNTEDKTNSQNSSTDNLSTPMLMLNDFIAKGFVNVTKELETKHKDIQLFKKLKFPEKVKEKVKGIKKKIKNQRSLKFIHHDHRIRLPKHKLIRFVSLVPVERRLQLIEKSLVVENSKITKSEKLRKSFFEKKKHFDTRRWCEPSFKYVVKYSQLRTLVKQKYPEYICGNLDRFQSFESLFGKTEEVEVVWSIYDKFKTDKLYEVQKFEEESRTDPFVSVKKNVAKWNGNTFRRRFSKRPLNVCKIGTKSWNNARTQKTNSSSSSSGTTLKTIKTDF